MTLEVISRYRRGGSHRKGRAAARQHPRDPRAARPCFSPGVLALLWGLVLLGTAPPASAQPSPEQKERWVQRLESGEVLLVQDPVQPNSLTPVRRSALANSITSVLINRALEEGGIEDRKVRRLVRLAQRAREISDSVSKVLSEGASEADADRRREETGDRPPGNEGDTPEQFDPGDPRSVQAWLAGSWRYEMVFPEGVEGIIRDDPKGTMTVGYVACRTLRGTVQCELHGGGRPDRSPESWFSFEGTYRDGAVRLQATAEQTVDWSYEMSGTLSPRTGRIEGHFTFYTDDRRRTGGKWQAHK